MSHALEAVISSLRNDQQQLRTIAQNVGGLNQPGFKRLLATGAADPAQTLPTTVDLRDGPLVATGRTLDLALENAGFFLLTEPDGTEVLTRAGRFQLDAEGQVVDAAGRRLMTDSGVLRLAHAQVEIHADGRIRQSGADLGRLAIRQPDAPLTPLAQAPALFRVADSAPAEGYRVHQGHIESANVDGATEMVRMIELSRHVESVQRALAIYDRALDAGINRLGDA